MSKLGKVLKKIDAIVNKVQPSTMDEFIDLVNKTPGLRDYGHSFEIVEYMGALQGVQISVSGRTKQHVLPGNGKAYGVFKGLEPYYAAGFKIVNPK